MNILLSTGSILSFPIDELFKIAKEAGFDGLELVIDGRFQDPYYVKKVVKSTDILPVPSIHAPYKKIKTWGNQRNALKKVVEMASIFGAKNVTFHPPSWFSLEIGFLRWFINVKDFQEEVGDRDIRLSIENMPLTGKRFPFPSYYLNDYSKMIRFGLERNLHFTFDTTHIGTFGHDPVSVFIEYYRTGRLVNIHISDFSGFKSHLLIKKGDLPLIKLLNTALRLGYDGNMTLEISPEELPKTREWVIKILKHQSSLLCFHTKKDGL
ncbi:MAG: sugar phosphate isomerase/epimerase [Syntrophorhabdaceae bacterium]|nr:sugar phosphate isomerase/epimerase [Syntrophorhabdaceae bacterium]